PVLRSFAKELFLALARGRQQENEFRYPLLRNTPAVSEGIARLTSDWKQHAPGVQAMEAFFRTLQPDEHFYALGVNLEDRALRRDLQIHLHALSSGREFTAVKAELMD